MKIDFLIEKKWTDANGIVFWLVLERLEIVSKFSYNLVVLFLVYICNFADEVKVLLPFEEFLLIFKDLRLHLRRLTEIGKLLEVGLNKLNLRLCVINHNLLRLGFFRRTGIVAVQTQKEINFLYFFVMVIGLLCFLLLCTINILPLLFGGRLNSFLLLVKLLLVMLVLLLFVIDALRFDLYLLRILSLFLLRRLLSSVLDVFLSLELLFKIGQLFLLPWRMVEVAVGTLPAVPLHKERAVLAIFSEMDEGAVLLSARAPLKVSTDFPSLH